MGIGIASVWPGCRHAGKWKCRYEAWLGGGGGDAATLDGQVDAREPLLPGAGRLNQRESLRCAESRASARIENAADLIVAGWKELFSPRGLSPLAAPGEREAQRVARLEAGGHPTSGHVGDSGATAFPAASRTSK